MIIRPFDGKCIVRLTNNFIQSGKTTVNLKNHSISSLLQFINDDLLGEIQRGHDLVQGHHDLFLATEWNKKEGPTRLPNSANQSSEIKDLMQLF